MKYLGYARKQHISAIFFMETNQYIHSPFHPLKTLADRVATAMLDSPSLRLSGLAFGSDQPRRITCYRHQKPPVIHSTHQILSAARRTYTFEADSE